MLSLAYYSPREAVKNELTNGSSVTNFPNAELLELYINWNSTDETMRLYVFSKNGVESTDSSGRNETFVSSTCKSLLPENLFSKYHKVLVREIFREALKKCVFLCVPHMAYRQHLEHNNNNNINKQETDVTISHSMHNARCVLFILSVVIYYFFPLDVNVVNGFRGTSVSKLRVYNLRLWRFCNLTITSIFTKANDARKFETLTFQLNEERRKAIKQVMILISDARQLVHSFDNNLWPLQAAVALTAAEEVTKPQQHHRDSIIAAWYRSTTCPNFSSVLTVSFPP